MDNRDYKKLFLITFVALAVLFVVLLYFLFIRPKFQGYVVDQQVQAQQALVINILTQIQQQGYVAIPLNQTTNLILVPYNSNQQVVQQPQTNSGN